MYHSSYIFRITSRSTDGGDVDYHMKYNYIYMSLRYSDITIV